MRKTTLIGLLAVWAGATAVGFAQVSTFPSPPPLAPPPSESAEPATNSPPAVSTFPAPQPSSDDTRGGAASGAASSTTGGGTGAASSFLSPAATTATDLTTTPVTAATLNTMAALDDKVVLEPGDRISFRVIEDRDDAVPRLVTDTGEVDFPYVGRLKVTGLTCRQVADQLKKLLEVDYYKRATVIVGLDVIVGHVAEVTHEMVWIVGQVRQVGPQELPKQPPTTVSQVILRAGGFGDFADERKVRLVHRSIASPSSTGAPSEASDSESSPEGQVIDVKSVFEGHSALDPIVRPNDLIIVPKRLINF